MRIQGAGSYEHRPRSLLIQMPKNDQEVTNLDGTLSTQET